MRILWEKINGQNEKLIESWMSENDKHNLCMETKNWTDTARDISLCLKDMNNGWFGQYLGYVGSPAQPVVAIMLGIEESGKALNLYNIIVNPSFRGLGIAKQAIRDIFDENCFSLNKTYSRIKVFTLPKNPAMKKILLEQNFDEPQFDGEFLFYKKDLTKQKKEEQSK